MFCRDITVGYSGCMCVCNLLFGQFVCNSFRQPTIGEEQLRTGIFYACVSLFLHHRQTLFLFQMHYKQRCYSIWTRPITPHITRKNPTYKRVKKFFPPCFHKLFSHHIIFSLPSTLEFRGTLTGLTHYHSIEFRGTLTGISRNPDGDFAEP